MVTPRVIPENDTKNPDYGKSLENLQAEYLWLKAQADLGPRPATSPFRFQ